MTFFELIFLGFGLGMDAFAVSICKGLSMKKGTLKKAIVIGLYFGFFQAFMPVLGYSMGKGFSDLLQSIDHWVTFLLLDIIGIKMIKDSFEVERGLELDGDIGFKPMLFLAIATSIDALAVGITFAFLKINIWNAALIIGVITFALSVIGTIIGNKFGNNHKEKAELAGGVILIVIGIRILIKHVLG